MEMFKIENAEISGVKIIHPFYAPDERGYFMKTYEREIFKDNGINIGNAEDIVSFSKKGVLRGLHFQTMLPQDKLVRVYTGEVYDVVVDLRKESPTFGHWQGFYLSGENRLGLYIPSGFAHGYLALSDDVIFSYRCGQPYAANYDSGIKWNDAELRINWPLEGIQNLIISTKDQRLQSFADFREKEHGL